MLAAIVFTDVVGFSTMASMDEAKALRLLERDTVIVRQTAEAHGAIVVKSTGDGMLMCFASAVEAVQAAMEIQDALHLQGASLPSTEVLRHRLGVHLGDVVILPGDVVGDGVNVAARLQSEAKPGGIAISDTVYGVVRGKVNFKATNLGPRNLKHIVETVNVWMIPPSDEPVPVGKAIHPPTQPGFELDARRDDGPTGGRLLALLVAIVVCVVGISVVATMLNSANRNLKSPTLANAGKTDPTPPPAATDSTVTPPDGTQVPSTTAGASGATPPAASPGTPGATEPPIDDEIAKLAADYEFDVAADQLERRADAASQTARVTRLRRMGEFRRWLEGGIGSATETSPLLVRGGGSQSDKDYEIWTVAGKTQVRLQDGTVETVTLRKFEPRELLRITGAIFKRENASPSEKLNILQRARDFAIEMRIGKLPDGVE